MLAAACYFVYTRGSRSGAFGANQENESYNSENPMFDRSGQQKGHYMDVQSGWGLGGYVDVAPNSQRTSGYMDFTGSNAQPNITGYVDVAPNSNQNAAGYVDVAQNSETFGGFESSSSDNDDEEV